MRVLVLFILLLPQLGVSQVSFFNGDYEQLKAKAKSEQRVFFIDMYTSWCGYCKKMDATTFRDELLGEYVASKFLAYKMDAEQFPGKDLAAKYGVKGYPTVLVFNYNGELIDKIVGYKDAVGFKSALEKHASISKVKNVDISLQEKYFQFQRDDMAALERSMFFDSNDRFSVEKQRAMNFGQENQRFDFEEFQFDVQKESGEEKAKEMELYYHLGTGDAGAIKSQLLRLKEKGYLSDKVMSYFVRYFSIDTKPEVEQLRWVNELVLRKKSEEFMELKAFVQYRFGDYKDAKDTLKQLDKQLGKNSNERLVLLKELLQSVE